MTRNMEWVRGWMHAAVASACLFVTGCSSVSPNLAKYDAQMAAPMTAEQARVCFVRQSAMLGAAVPHSVVEIGSNVVGDTTFIDTTSWRPAGPQTMKQFFTVEESLGTFLLEYAVGRELVRDKPVCFTIGDTAETVPPNSDLMDAAYLALPAEVLRRTGLSGTPIATWDIPQLGIRYQDKDGSVM